jgi:type IV pilus assembly protein PilM
MSANIVGVDIGSAGLRAVEVSDGGKAKPTLVRYHEVPLPEGAVSRGEVVEPNTVAAALKQLWSGGGFKSKNVVLGMGNHRVLSRDLTVPKAPLARIRESLPFQVQDMLPVPVEDALLDFYPISESDGESGPQVAGLLIAAVKEAVTGNVKAVELAGLLPVDVDLIPFALTRVLNRGVHLEGTVIQVDVGSGTTSIVVTTNGVPQFVRLIPAGGEDVTKALVEKLSLTPEEADVLKRAHGLGKDVAQEAFTAVSLIRDVTTELLNSIRNTAHYFTNTRPVSISRIVLTGGGSHLPGFAEGLAELTRLPVAEAQASPVIAYARSLNRDALELSRGAYLVALGLALRSAA